MLICRPAGADDSPIKPCEKASMSCIELTTRCVDIYAAPKRVVFVDIGSVEQIELQRNSRTYRYEWSIEQTFANQRASVTNLAECLEPQAFDSICPHRV